MDTEAQLSRSYVFFKYGILKGKKPDTKEHVPMKMLHNEQSQFVFAQSKHPIMAVIHMYSLTGQKKKATMRHCNSSRTNDNSSLLKSSGSFKKKTSTVFNKDALSIRELMYRMLSNALF